MTDYIQERAESIERCAQARIEIIESLLPFVVTATSQAESGDRMGAMLVLLLRIQAELLAEKAAALRVIESTCELRRTTQDIPQ